MNIYQTVIESVAADAADIVESGGFLNIKGTSSLFIPKAGVVAARRVLAGEKRQVWTVTAPGTPSNSTTYSVTVSGKSPVTGIMKSFYSVYTTPVSGVTDASLAQALANGFAVSADFPFEVSYTSGASFTLTAKSGTPVISAAVSPSTGSAALTVANTTTALTSTGTATAGSTNTALTSGTSVFGSANASRGIMVTIADPSVTVGGIATGTFYTGIITANADGTNATALPIISASTAGANDKLFTVDNTGSVIENVYAYAGLAGVNLTAGTRYVIYEIDAIGNSEAGNGARPDVIDSKYVIYVNATDADTWTSTGFDAVLAAKCGLSNF